MVNYLSNYKLFLLGALAGIILCTQNCTYNKADVAPKAISNCDTTAIKYAGKIKPVLEKNCYGCHSNTANSKFGGNINLEKFDDLKSYTNAVVQSINQQNPDYKAMPPSGKLEICDIKSIELWVAKGSPND